MTTPISSLSGDIWPLICEYLAASDICELQCSGYRPFLKFLSYSNLHDLNLHFSHSRPFIWPSWLSPTSTIRSLSIIGHPSMMTRDWNELNMSLLPKTLTSLKLNFARTFSPFYAPSSGITDTLRLQIDEMFPALLLLSLAEPTTTHDIYEFLLPRNLTSFRTTTRLYHKTPSWPENLMHLMLPCSDMQESWILYLPITLQTLICGPTNDLLLPLLSARLPNLQTLERSIVYQGKEYKGGETLGSMLPRGLTSLNWPGLSVYSRVQIRPYVTDLPLQLTRLDLGAFNRLEASDAILIPRTVTDWGFIIQTVSCLEAVPPKLQKLTYRAQNIRECGIGAFIPKHLTFLDLEHTRLPDSEYHLLPPSLTELKLNCLNNASVRGIGHLKYLQTLRIYGGKLSKAGFLCLPRSLAVLFLARSFIAGTDAFHDSLPNLESFDYIADPIHTTVLEPGVFQKLPLSLTRLRLMLGPSHSRYPWTNELLRLTNLRIFDSLGAPYDSNLKGLVELPPSLTTLSCYPSWPISSNDILRFPKNLVTVRLKSTKGHRYTPDDTKHFPPSLSFRSTSILLHSHHSLYDKTYDS